MSEPFTLWSASGAIDYHEGIVASGQDVVTRCSDGFVAADHLIHGAGFEGCPEPQPLKNGLALSDGLIHGDSSG